MIKIVKRVFELCERQQATLVGLSDGQQTRAPTGHGVNHCAPVTKYQPRTIRPFLNTLALKYIAPSCYKAPQTRDVINA